MKNYKVVIQLYHKVYNSFQFNFVYVVYVGYVVYKLPYIAKSNQGSFEEFISFVHDFVLLIQDEF